MSHGRQLPGSIVERLEHIEGATDRLVRAVASEDFAAVDAALEQRGELIAALKTDVVEIRQRHGEDAEESLRQASRALDAGAKRAFAALEEYRGKAGAVLQRLAREGNALRAYGDGLPAAGSFDRSG